MSSLPPRISRMSPALAAAQMTPESESLAPEPSNVYRGLSAYIRFLAVLGKVEDTSVPNRVESVHFDDLDPAIFDANDLSSPLAYCASRTALLLLDFQGFVVNSCGLPGLSALSKAKAMRDWAFANRIPVIHSVIDVREKPFATRKASPRLQSLLSCQYGDQDSTEEPTEIAFSQREGEYIALKNPGFVSALKSTGLLPFLREKNIESLVLCGLNTSDTVLQTATSATDDGFVVSVIRDACSDPSEVLHGTLMENVLPLAAHVADAEEFIDSWAKDPRRCNIRHRGMERL